MHSLLLVSCPILFAHTEMWIPLTEMTSVGEDFDRSIRLKIAIEKAFEENAELLERLGSDYDEHGVPYWEGGPS